MTDSTENMLIKVHKLQANGMINSSVQFEINNKEEIISQTKLNCNGELTKWGYLVDDKINLNYHRFEDKSPTITLIKIGSVDELNPMNYLTKISESTNEEIGSDKYLFTATNGKLLSGIRSKVPLTIPSKSVISCQNCDTSFPTKYQYQRHQCEFNAEKVVLKPEIIGKDFDKATRLKFRCDVCNKAFVSNNNLERHKNCHRKETANVCEHCNKPFVSENRLKIHKENHCKKAGDTMKFYRSDVAVWKCDWCSQVFATEAFGSKHIEACHTMEKKSEPNLPKYIETTPKPEPLNAAQSPTLVAIQNMFNPNRFGPNFEQSHITCYNETVPISLQKVITEILYQCEFCNGTYASKQSMIDHQRLHTTARNYECLFCKQYFDNYTEAAIHWQNKCNDNSNLFYLPKMVYCEHCDRGFKSHEILYNHKNKKKHFTLKMFAKNEAEAKNESERAIMKLIENVLTKMDRQTAETTATVADTNEMNLDNDNSNQSLDAGKKKRGRKRKWHKTEMPKKTVEDGYRYQCERCGMVFETIPSLENHKEAVHASTFSCEQCGQVVHSAKALMIHCRAHQSLKPYVCDQCGRSYSQTSHLWQHMRFHQGIKPFACPHEGCEARYTIRPDLKDHIRKVHTRERPFKCSVCEKCFLTGSVYYQHRLIHTNDRRYGCDICTKRFFRADALNNHRRIHTDERPYPCPVCGREFRQKGDRNKHVRTQHSM